MAERTTSAAMRSVSDASPGMTMLQSPVSPCATRRPALIRLLVETVRSEAALIITLYETV